MIYAQLKTAQQVAGEGHLGTLLTEGKELETSFPTGLQQPELRKHLPRPQQETQKELPPTPLLSPMPASRGHILAGAAFCSGRPPVALTASLSGKLPSLLTEGRVCSRCVFPSQKKENNNPF